MNEFWEKAFLVALVTACQRARTAGQAVGDAVAIANEAVEKYPKGAPGCDGGWISVKDRLPDKDGVVLVHAVRSDWPTSMIDTVFYDEVAKGFPVGKSREWLAAIIHWMPLPDPPEATEGTVLSTDPADHKGSTIYLPVE